MSAAGGSPADAPFGGGTAGTWWQLLGPVEVPLECDGELHRLRWRAGLLEVADHPDPEGERTLGALGGTTAPCVDLFDAWHRHADDLRVLALASRGPDDVVPLPARDAGAGRPTAPRLGTGVRWPIGPTGPAGRATAVSWVSSWPASQVGPGRLGGAEPDGLLRLFASGGALWDRLVATVVATWAQRAADGDRRCARARPAMAAALYGRATGAVRRLVGDPALAVDVTMAPPGGDPAIGWDGDRVGLRLPFAWLRDLWVPGLGLLVGRLGLALLESSPDRSVIDTVGPDLVDHRPVTITVG
ncbi:MAG: hypothetical protein ACYCU7_12830 [Acidimicrobiales bacterium]